MLQARRLNMKITVDLPEDLLKEAMRLVKTGSETGTLGLALQALVEKKNSEMASAEVVDFDPDLE
jgi:Arc/MetJ family transcription regulator